MPSYLTATSNGLFILKSFEERGVHGYEYSLKLL